MSDDWDLFAVVRSCTNSTATAAATPPPPIITSSSISSPARVSRNREDPFVNSQFYFPGVIDERDDYSFQGLEEIYKELYLDSAAASAVPASSEEFQNTHHQQQVQPRVLQPPPPPQQQNQHLPINRRGIIGSSFPSPARPRRRKNQQAKVTHHMTQEELSTDSWAWRKYGQKPIKGSPYPRQKGRVQSKKAWFQVLKRAVELGVEFVEIGIEEATDELITVLKNKGSNSKIIISSYLNGGNPCKEKLCNLIIELQSTGADVIKFDVDVAYITDVAPIFHMLTHCQVPLIAKAVGDRGLISQLLGPKYGAFAVWGSLGNLSVPGLPSLLSIKQVYKLEYMTSDTKVFGVVSNPVGHSKGPLLHNPAFRHTGYDGIYVPLLVDNIKEFFRVYSCSDFAGFSVGIPHKEAAVGCCDEVHPLAKCIGAVNTIIRRPSDGKLVGYNTDCEACITAIEDALRERRITNEQASLASPIAGKLFVLVGAGGAGRAIAFGAKSRGARVVIFNRNFERAKSLALAVSGEAFPYEYLNTYSPEKGMILANASAVGMQPNVDKTPVCKESLGSYELVFDAVYTPRKTRLLREAAEVGAVVVSGVEMFIRQALGQFKLFTDGLAPEDFMRKIVLEKF